MLKKTDAGHHKKYLWLKKVIEDIYTMNLDNRRQLQSVSKVGQMLNCQGKNIQNHEISIQKRGMKNINFMNWKTAQLHFNH